MIEIASPRRNAAHSSAWLFTRVDGVCSMTLRKHLAITGATPNLLLTSATDLPLDRLMRQNRVQVPCRALHNAHARSSNPHFLRRPPTVGRN